MQRTTNLLPEYVYTDLLSVSHELQAGSSYYDLLMYVSIMWDRQFKRPEVVDGEIAISSFLVWSPGPVSKFGSHKARLHQCRVKLVDILQISFATQYYPLATTMFTERLARLPGGIQLSYTDSGAPATDLTDYTTVIIVHGMGFNARMSWQ